MEKYPDELSDCLDREGYALRDWDSDPAKERTWVLADIEYKIGMFSVKATIEEGKPITITLTETLEHFAKRQ
jgi:hypothetical protein